MGLLAKGAVGEVGGAACATGGYLGVATLYKVYSVKGLKIYGTDQ